MNTGQEQVCGIAELYDPRRMRVYYYLSEWIIVARLFFRIDRKILN